MKATVIAALVILPASFSVSAPQGASSSNGSGGSGTATSSSGSSSGGSASSGGGGHPSGGAPSTGPNGGSTARSRGTLSGHPGASGPISHGNYGRTLPPGASRLGPTTIQRLPTRSGIIQRGVPIRPGQAQLGQVAIESQPRISRPTMMLHQSKSTQRNILRTRDGRPHEGNWSRNDPANKDRFGRQTEDRLRNWQGRKSNWTEACHRHDDHHRHHHDHDWWHHHCDVVVLVDWGFWGWSDGWWYPAWGYDPNYSYYEYDGPVYGYDGLLPDEIVANVQSVLQDLGYYPYEVDGVFGPLTQEALARFQRDQGIPITGAIDPQTLSALGLLQEN